MKIELGDNTIDNVTPTGRNSIRRILRALGRLQQRIAYRQGEDAIDDCLFMVWYSDLLSLLPVEGYRVALDSRYVLVRPERVGIDEDWSDFRIYATEQEALDAGRIYAAGHSGWVWPSVAKAVRLTTEGRPEDKYTRKIKLEHGTAFAEWDYCDDGEWRWHFGYYTPYGGLHKRMPVNGSDPYEVLYQGIYDYDLPHPSDKEEHSLYMRFMIDAKS